MFNLAYSNLACPEWPFERTVEAVATYGFDGLEIRLFDGEVVTPAISYRARKRAESALQYAGVRVAALDTSLEVVTNDHKLFLVDVEAMSEIAQQWGAPLLRLFGGKLPRDPAARTEALKQAADLLEEAAPIAGHYYVRLALETHGHFSSARTVAEVLDRAGGVAGAVYDVHHPHRMGERPGDVLRLLGRHIVHVQVKDAVHLDDGWRLVPLGDGEVPVEEIVGMLPEIGYRGWVSLEFEKKWHPELAPPEFALAPQAARLRKWVEAVH